MLLQQYKIVCDRCKKEWDRERVWHQVFLVNLTEGWKGDYHLCADCSNQFHCQFIKDLPSPPSTEMDWGSTDWNLPSDVK